MLTMIWNCDGCHLENVCDVSNEKDFFAVILRAKSAHESINPACVWDPIKIHGRLVHSNVEVNGAAESR